jgi:hypothetical protein
MQPLYLGSEGRLVHKCLFTPKNDSMTKETAIGDPLVRPGIIDATGLSRARETQEKSGILLRKALTTWGLADEQSLVEAIAQGMRLEAREPELPDIPADVAGLLPSDFCRKRTVVPLRLQGKSEF